MMIMKKIKIFLASSIEDLREDRVQIGDYFRQLNEIYLDSGVHFSLIKCEDYDNSIVSGGKQTAYDREIRESELCFFLFFRKVGDYTRHEFDVALEAFRRSDKPKIVTYIKYVTSIRQAEADVSAFMRMLDGELHHYYNTYDHIDTLKLGILMQIKLLGLDASEMSLSDGSLRLNGTPLLSSKNVPIFRGNGTLTQLTEEKRQRQTALNEARLAYLGDPTEENEACFFEASAALNAVSKKLTGVEKEALSFASTVAEMTSEGRVLTYRQRDALKYFNEGDYDRAQAILEDEERENELERAQNRAASGVNEIKGYVEEELLWIKAEFTRGITVVNTDRVVARYEKIKQLSEQYQLEKGFWFGYIELLRGLNRHYDALALAKKLMWYYEMPGQDCPLADKAKLLVATGLLQNTLQQYDEAEKSYLASREMYNSLCENRPELYQSALAVLNSNLGFLYTGLVRYKEAEQAYREAIERSASLYEGNPKTYWLPYATFHSNLGMLYMNQHRLDEAESVLLFAIELTKGSMLDEEATLPLLSNIYGNLANCYNFRERFDDAERLHLCAVESNVILSEKNPEAYEPALATSYNNLGFFYSSIGKFEEALLTLDRADKIQRALCRKVPNAFDQMHATILSNRGLAYFKTEAYEEAGRDYTEALEILDRLSETQPEANEPLMLTLYMNLSALHTDTERYEEAECYLEKQRALIEKLLPKNPMHYLQMLFFTFQSRILLSAAEEKYDEAEAYCREALTLFGTMDQNLGGLCKDYLDALEILQDLIESFSYDDEDPD